MSYLLEDLQRFLSSSPTSWHAVQQIGNRLAVVDFNPLEEAEKWDLVPGGSYFVQRGGSICAFKLPTKIPSKAIIMGSHTDSPALKIKPRAEIHAEKMTLLGTELYGSPILSTWFNRDLSIAGRVVLQNLEGAIEEKLVFFDEAPVLIPQIPIHLDRDSNEKKGEIHKQDQLRPVVALEEISDYLRALLKRETFYQTMLAFDLMLVPIEQSRFLGMNGEMLASYRLDNLASAHACMVSLASCEKADHLQMAFFWDHEEIGSRSAEGGGSSFLEDVLKRVSIYLGMSDEDIFRMKAQSLFVSVDVAHAYNPNYAAKFDPHHRLFLNQGIGLKYHAQGKYATDAATAAIIIAACNRLQLGYQSFASHSDIPCGTTLGPIVAERLGIPTVDIGIPLLSMHAAREVMACQDHLDMCTLLTHVLNL